MHPHLTILHHFPLKTLNSFGIAAYAAAYMRVTSLDDLAEVIGFSEAAALPRLILGGGSNVLFTGDFNGLVLHMCNQGRAIVGADDDVTYVRAAAGENWHEFVQWTLAQGLHGLENLSLIPGTVGAAPIQNIGAYGAELQDLFHCATVFEIASGTTFVMDKAACRFAYRDSIFKHPDGAGLIVVDVTFALPRHWRPNLRYAELAQAVDAAGFAAPTAQQVSDTVVAIRRRKLPDPAVIGNAGSFFKNPVVSKQRCAALLAAFPALVHHSQTDGSEKLAAGWLIDQAGWKGRNLGPAGVYPKQALVLVNNGGASGADITRLAQAIQAEVLQRYGVVLEPEPVYV